MTGAELALQAATDRSRASRYLTTAQVSAWTGIPAETLRYWRFRGDTGPASFKLGPRRVVYDAQDVDAWIASARAAC